MARKASTAEWDVQDAPPTAVKKVRNAGRQFAPAKTKVSEAAERRAVRVAAVAQQTRESVRRRAGWERSTEGKKRMHDVVDYGTEQHNKMIREHPEFGMTPVKRLGMSHAQLYHAYDFKDQPSSEPTIHDRQLPGMEDPDALPRPKRWEEHTPREQEDISKRVKKVTGATSESMERSFGAQLDQGHIRARQAGASEPYSQRFYSHGEPAQVLRASSRRHNVPLGLVSAVNADTSPQMKFSYTHKSGETTYPNAEQADHAIKQVKAGKTPGRVTKKGLVGLARSGFDTNFAKAAKRAHQVIRGGKSVSETYMGTGGGSGFGPKTAAYHNAWLTNTPQFLVSDVHTGGGGMLPHLGTYKASGVNKQKSEREEGIATLGFHAMADYAARQAMHKRGLGRLGQAQAAQWGEERIRRHDQATDPRVKTAFTSHEQAYPSSVKNPRQFHEHDEKQGRLF